MLKRTISAVVLIGIGFVAFYFGGPVLALLILAFSLIGFYELAKALGVHGEGEKLTALEIAGMVMIVIMNACAFAGCSLKSTYGSVIMYILLLAPVIFGMLAIMAVYVFSFPKYNADKVVSTVFAYFYLPVQVLCIYMIREGFEGGLYLVWLVIIISAGADTFAYLVGVAIGKHKMAPKLSPKKSFEGLFGGLIGGTALTYVYIIYVLNPHMSESLVISPVAAVLLGFVGSVLTVLGDLSASGIKRDKGIKDYGNIIPGHGGIMDRFDSHCVVASFLFIGLSIITAVK